MRSSLPYRSNRITRRCCGCSCSSSTTSSESSNSKSKNGTSYLKKKFRNSWHPSDNKTTTLHRLPLLLLTETPQSTRGTHGLRSSNISLKHTAILRIPKPTGTIVSDDRPPRITSDQLNIFPTTTALLTDNYQMATNQQQHHRSFSARFHDQYLQPLPNPLFTTIP